MKLYIISGLGADRKVFENIIFPGKFSEIIFIDWLMPHQEESLGHYVERMAASIDETEAFCLLGYSFGGIVVQEIHKLKPAKKIVILGSIKSHKEKSIAFQLARKSKIFEKVSESYFNEEKLKSLEFIRKVFHPKLWHYFTIKTPSYLKWSINKILEWESEENPEVVQILADRDIIFPSKNSKPNYIVYGGTHLFPVTKGKEVSRILEEVFC